MGGGATCQTDRRRRKSRYQAIHRALKGTKIGTSAYFKLLSQGTERDGTMRQQAGHCVADVSIEDCLCGQVLVIIRVDRHVREAHDVPLFPGENRRGAAVVAIRAAVFEPLSYTYIHACIHTCIRTYIRTCMHT